MELKPIDEGQVVQIPIDQIEPDPKQPRRAMEPTALDDLAKDIKARGVQQPITIRKPITAGDLYIIKYGERRWIASRLAGKKTISCILAGAEKLVHDKSDRNLERLFDQAKENHEREPLNALDWAYMCKRMKDDWGMTAKQIADEFEQRGIKNMSRPHVSNLMRLTELPVWAQDMIRANALTGGHGKHLFAALHSPKVEEEIRTQLASQLDDPPSVRELEQAIRDAYIDLHRRAYELAQFTPEERVGLKLEDIGVLELGNDRFVLDQPKYESALTTMRERRRARHQAASGGEAREHGDDDDDDDTDRYGRPQKSSGDAEDDDEPGSDPTENPLWAEHDATQAHEGEQSVRRSLARFLSDTLAGLGDDFILNVATWSAFGRGKLDQFGERRHWRTQDETAYWLDDMESADAEEIEALGEVLTGGNAVAWFQMAPAQREAAQLLLGKLALKNLPVEDLAAIAPAFGITVDNYRVNAEYLWGLDREKFASLCNLPSVADAERIPSDIPFEQQVEALLEHAASWQVPDDVRALWDELTNTVDEEAANGGRN